MKEKLNYADLRVRIRSPAFHTAMSNFNTRQLFNEAIEQDIPAENVLFAGGVVRDTLSRRLNQPNQGWNDHVEAKACCLIDMGALYKNLVQYVSQFYQRIREASVAQIDIPATTGMTAFLADFSLYLVQLQASLSKSLTLRQQNESAANAMNGQLQQRITIMAWPYEDSRLLCDDINTLSTTEHT